MPVARIITQYPEESQELVRQLTAAGYTVKFTAPDEEFDDADLVVSAANVHHDFALQYAAEVAQDCNAEVIVAPGVVRGAAEETRVVEAAGEPFGDQLRAVAQGLQGRWQSFRNERALAREQKRLDRERQAMEAEDRRRESLRLRAAEEARVAAERERQRVERQAREEEMRRAATAEMARIAAETERIAVERERLRVEREAQEEERRRIAEAERQRAVTIPAPADNSAPVLEPPPPVQVPAPPAPVATGRRAVPVQRPRVRRQTMQRALVAASIAALVLMIAFAIAINMDTRSPLPNGVVNSTVQEEAPFGPAHSQAPPMPVVHAATPAPQAARPASTIPKTKPPAARPARRSRPAGNGYISEDDVVVHHYGQARKRPPSSQTRAGIPHYSDQE